MASQYIPRRSGTALMINRPNAVSIQLDSDDDLVKYVDSNGIVRKLIPESGAGGMPKTTVGIGAAVTGKAIATEYGIGPLHQTSLALLLSGADDLDLADGAANGIGAKVYDFPAGRILILGATIDASVTVNDAFNASPNDVFNVAVGAVDGTQAADGDLTGTEADIIPKSSLDTVGNTTLTLPWKSALAASAHMDGTTTPIDVFVNAGVVDASTTKAVTVAITGTLTITWINLGDY